MLCNGSHHSPKAVLGESKLQINLQAKGIYGTKLNLVLLALVDAGLNELEDIVQTCAAKG